MTSVAQYQGFEQVANFEIEDQRGAKLRLEETAAWQDDQAIDLVTYRGASDGLDTIQLAAGEGDMSVVQQKSNRTSHVTYRGADAIRAHKESNNLNPKYVDRRIVTTFIVVSASGDLETVVGTRYYVWDVACGGWWPQSGPRYRTKSNYDATRRDGDEFEIRGNTYKANHHVIEP